MPRRNAAGMLSAPEVDQRGLAAEAPENVTNEAFARIKIDQLLRDTGWRLTDGLSVRYEYPVHDATASGRAPDWGKLIVFAVTKSRAETLARMFDGAFPDKQPTPTTRYADFVVSGLGPDDSVDGSAKIRRFKKEQFPQILVSVNMLDTGFDCPDVRNLVMARFTHGSILYQQLHGRGTRLSPGSKWIGRLV